MTSDQRLAEIAAALEGAGVSFLVMGGHAVRFYGLQRTTVDFDLQVSPEQWDDLPERLARTGLCPAGAVIEGPSWRVDSFRRFRIGTLPDGRDEWLEFWKENHLLPSYTILRPRAESGEYGGRRLWFLGLVDLIRSKETERDADWSDVAVLEQVRDARLIARMTAGNLSTLTALVALRSRTGFEALFERGCLRDTDAVAGALAETVHPVTQAFLIPFAPDAPCRSPLVQIEPVLTKHLRHVVGAGPLHLSLVEVVRRRYIAVQKDVDRRNKESIREQQRS